MKNNKLNISAAGSGKTTFLVNKALALDKTKQILITTYTIDNEEEIRKKILEKRKTIPSNITVKGWFSFLLQHGVRPYQGSMNEMLFENDIKGMLLSEGKSAPKFDENGRPLYLRGGKRQYYGEADFKEFYFTPNWRIYSDKITKFIVGCNKKLNGEIISRVSRIYSHIFIDEVQDLAGYDLEIIKLLFKSSIETILVGDPRQVTYLTNHYRKYPKYKYGKIKEFLQNECKSLIDENSIDETSLKKSHRNNLSICEYSSKLYTELEKSEPCDCEICRSKISEHEGVFLIKPEDVYSYLDKYNNSIQLIWDKRTEVNTQYPVKTFGKSKGKNYERVIIYPTEPIKKWICNNQRDLANAARSKFYVALTRAKHSAAIVLDYQENEEFEGIKIYTPELSEIELSE